MSDDVFEELLEASWRGIPFPVTKMKASLAHDLVEHKYWGVDGARVESTGLAPWRFSFSVPFINGLSRARGETWSNLYPAQMLRTANAMQNKAAAYLQHPEFGNVWCKAEKFDIDWEGGRRGGVEVEMSFVETQRDDQNLSTRLRLGVNVVDESANELDDATVKADLKALLLAAGLDLPPYLADESISFGEFMNSIKAVTDYPTLLSMRAGGKIDAVIYQADRVAKSAAKARSALTWPVTQNVERMKAAAHDLRENLVSTSRRVGVFTVPHDTTIAGVARQLPGNVKMGDVIKLNPALMLNPEVLKGTRVRYYVE